MSNLAKDLLLTFTVTPLLLCSIFYINCRMNIESKVMDEKVESTGYKLTPTEKYIQRFKDVAIGEHKKFGIPASIILAQGILESGSGSSDIATDENNHFGIKCFAKNCKKGHCNVHEDDSPNDRFKHYESAWMSYRDHSKFLSRGMYKDLKGLGWRAYADGLQDRGYATSKKYSRKIKSLILKYKLYQYDK